MLIHRMLILKYLKNLKRIKNQENSDGFVNRFIYIILIIFY